MTSIPRSQEKPTRRLAKFSASLTYDDLPEEVVGMVKRLILDTLGTALAATTLGAGCREVVETMRDLGGKPESTIIGHPFKVGAPNAAFANGGLAHALNYDSTGPEVGHVGIACLVAPLAMAEAVGGISGRRFLAAAAVATETASRVAAAAARTGRNRSKKFLTGQHFGYFGCAAGAGHVLGLNAEKMESALGLALMQASGSMQLVLGGDPPAKAIYGAFPNHGGVLAALLSNRGLRAECDVFEGPAGLYGMICEGEADIDTLVDGLGTEFLLMGSQFKPWPTSGVIHPFIEAAIEIARNGLEVSKIEKVEILGPERIQTWCEPLDERRRPHNQAAASNSILFGVAKALVHGDVTLTDFTVEGLKDEAAIDIAGRTNYRLDDQIEGGIVKVETRDGEHLESHVETPLGNPLRPITSERLRAKFHDCCRYSIAPLSSDSVRGLIDMIDNLEEVTDVADLVKMAGGQDRPQRS